MATVHRSYAEGSSDCCAKLWWWG